MKELITQITFKKEVETKYGKMFQFDAHYNEKVGSFLSKKKEQTAFKIGEENEFTETAREYNGTTFYNIKAISQGGGSNFNRQLKKEQSRYSTMGASYVKDLIIADKIKMADWHKATSKIVGFMLDLDKKLGNG